MRLFWGSRVRLVGLSVLAAAISLSACATPPQPETMDRPSASGEDADPFASWDVRADPDIRTFDPELLGACFIIVPDDVEMSQLPFGGTLDRVVRWVVVEPDGPVPDVTFVDAWFATVDLGPLGPPQATARSAALVDRTVAERLLTAVNLDAEVYLGLAEFGEGTDPATAMTTVAVLDGEIAPLNNCAHERERPEFERAARSLNIEAAELIDGLARGIYAVPDAPYWAADIEPQPAPDLAEAWEAQPAERRYLEPGSAPEEVLAETELVGVWQDLDANPALRGWSLCAISEVGNGGCADLEGGRMTLPATVDLSVPLTFVLVQESDVAGSGVPVAIVDSDMLERAVIHNEDGVLRVRGLPEAVAAAEAGGEPSVAVDVYPMEQADAETFAQQLN